MAPLILTIIWRVINPSWSIRDFRCLDVQVLPSDPLRCCLSLVYKTPIKLHSFLPRVWSPFYYIVLKHQKAWAGHKYPFFIQQGDKESLRGYMSHFKIAMLEVYDLDQSIMISTLKKGLKASPFYSSFKEIPLWFHWNVARVDNYILWRKRWWKSVRRKESGRGLRKITSFLIPRSKRIVGAALSIFESPTPPGELHTSKYPSTIGLSRDQGLGYCSLAWQDE